MRRTLLWLCVYVCAGIVCARFWHPPLAVYCLSLALLLASRLLLETSRLFSWALAALAVCCGATAYSASQLRPQDDIQRLLRRFPQRCSATVEAVVLSASRRKADTWVVLLAARSLRIDPAYLYRCSGRLQAQCRWDVPGNGSDILSGLHAGQVVHLQGMLRRSWPLPILRLAGVSQCRLVDRRCSLSGLAEKTKDAVVRSLQRHLAPTAAAVTAAMVLGDRRGLSPLLYRQMIRTGTVHILVVSGFNVGIIACVVLLFLKVLRIPRAVRFFLAAALVAGYCLVCGGSTPVVRAGLMAMVCMFSLLARRQADMLTACACSALCILVSDPGQLFSPSFQLSYASVLSLIGIFPRLRSVFPRPDVLPAPVGWVLDAALVSLAAWLGTAPFIAWYFGMVAPVALLANICIPALAGLITLCGCLLITVSYVCPYFASPFASALEALVYALLRLNGFFHDLGPVYFFFDKARGL